MLRLKRKKHRSLYETILYRKMLVKYWRRHRSHCFYYSVYLECCDELSSGTSFKSIIASIDELYNNPVRVRVRPDPPHYIKDGIIYITGQIPRPFYVTMKY